MCIRDSLLPAHGRRDACGEVHFRSRRPAQRGLQRRQCRRLLLRRDHADQRSNGCDVGCGGRCGGEGMPDRRSGLRSLPVVRAARGGAVGCHRTSRPVSIRRRIACPIAVAQSAARSFTLQADARADLWSGGACCRDEKGASPRGVISTKVKLKFPKPVATAIQLTYDSLNAKLVNLALAQVVSHGS